MRGLGLAAVATAVTLALPAAAGAQQRTISVGGQATLTARNDTARVGFGVASEQRTRRAALNASSRRTRKVIAALRAKGIAARDIRTGTITVTAIRRARSRRVRRYRVRQNVRATVREARRAGSIVSTGVDAGATSVSGPEFYIANERALFRRALGIAFEDARATATVLARQAGLTLGRALAIRESSFSDAGGTNEQGAFAPAPVQRQEDSAPAPTRPGTTTVEAIVDVVFEAG